MARDNENNNDQKRWLQYLNYLLMMLATLLIAFYGYKVGVFQDALAELPEKYVRLERYKCDMEIITKQYDRILNRLDEIAKK